ncbi:hypothetical protein COV53_05045 [Candidatus Gottesmanbacteria bacterium CG11_big_fil_rev_8_21_14_0_20_37_11]|uniref:Uncharacterized protein n=3 Tax=Candidatus Gottesmaniibacteriota TaxID=1752720 RepID=A0A2M7RR23_9BACT|nr:MAG: hypothetical protein AUJ73_00790 [Candidatus Gottesmanbacteria bacterium CG1_02_37_22]PIP32591.1 MAG: hypothetical protein COX23_03890 [Candidatus Gottesmanbacteria bacterium CG23_combo_of_CG06-09_8_20_14_all_37_19]PIR08046.1 MAG: hypothetical protein COV53_05045 [Candidatus Gottesmanbacteria bacterium CG11_big_fil_rev_8_21_14_0_20_37_11]PIZ02499.1 MAG: hypothetical protein COY59_04475 [Candidatus Gottesmanbacteria bacterium CG_4_10_14_0_8_um_filter_37_24]
MCRYHSDKKQITNELKVAHGMIKKSLVLLARNSSSLEILKHSKQAEGRLQKICSMILSNHIHHCILPIRRQKDIKDPINKLLESFRLVQKYNLTITNSYTHLTQVCRPSSCNS